MDVKTWYITGKGYVSSQCTDSLTGDSFSDIYRDWSQYIFTGTEDELDDMLLEMSRGDLKRLEHLFINQRNTICSYMERITKRY